MAVEYQTGALPATGQQILDARLTVPQEYKRAIRRAAQTRMPWHRRAYPVPTPPRSLLGPPTRRATAVRQSHGRLRVGAERPSIAGSARFDGNYPNDIEDGLHDLARPARSDLVHVGT